MSLPQIILRLLGESLGPRGSPDSQLYKSRTENIDAFDADWYKAGITHLGNASASPRACGVAARVQALFVT